jgi:hypothetical protein
MFVRTSDILTGPWIFFQPWKMATWEFFGYKAPGGDTYEQLEPEAWREALLDVVEWMIWANKGNRMRLINMVCEINFHTRFLGMRQYTPFAKENLLAKRGIKRRLAIKPFDQTVRARGFILASAPTHKSEYLGERDDLTTAGMHLQ